METGGLAKIIRFAFESLEGKCEEAPSCVASNETAAAAAIWIT